MKPVTLLSNKLTYVEHTPSELAILNTLSYPTLPKGWVGSAVVELALRSCVFIN